jgi:hypothetical protein
MVQDKLMEVDLISANIMRANQRKKFITCPGRDKELDDDDTSIRACGARMVMGAVIQGSLPTRRKCYCPVCGYNGSVITDLLDDEVVIYNKVVKYG